MSPRLQATIVALAAALACGLLGSSVSERPPAGIDVAGAALAGHLPYLALAFTASCWWESLVTLGVAAIVLAAVVPSWRRRVVFSIVTTLGAWQGSDLVKDLFGRQRPRYWSLIHETTASYPSGHAMFAVVVFGLWAYYVSASDVPQPFRTILVVLPSLWAIGILWSRLALGAHFVTDLAGGVLFGVAMLGIAAAVAGGIPSAVRVRA